jgi:hypothetical protein
MDRNPISSPAAFLRSPRRALTMVELLLALAITALVSAAVTAMLVATAYGTSSERDLRGAVTRSKLVGARLNAAVRSSRAVLETGTDYLVLWMGDINTNATPDAPDLSEIRLIERDGGTDELSSYQFPDGWTQAQIDAADVAYALTGNPPGFFLNEAATAKAAGSLVPTRWGSQVTSILFDLDGADPITTTLVSYRFTVGAGDLSETVIGAASLRHSALN